MKYDFTAIEKKWQTRWAEEKTFACQNGDTTKPKFYGLVEFPYPSAAGLHVGHPRPYTAMDVIARKKRMDGYNVLLTWFIRDDQRQKLDNAYLKLLDRLGLKPMPAGGTEALLVPKDIPEQEEDGAPPDAPGSVQSTPVPEQKPGAACSTQPAAPSAAPKGSTAKAEQAQVSSAAGSRSRTPSSAPSQNTYEYRVAASKVQKGMNTVNTLVRLEAADGKQVDAFAPGEHHALTVGTLLTGVRLSVRRQDTVVFYVLEDYRIATAPQAA